MSTWGRGDTYTIVAIIIAMLCAFQLGVWSAPSTHQMPTSNYAREGIRAVDIANLTGDDLIATRQTMRDVWMVNTLYHGTHTYMEGMFDCKFMAIDVWNMIESRGINARIVVGDTSHRADSIENATHAWVVAEVRPGSWVAVEPTGGYLICDDGVENICEKTNPLYYEGWMYENPIEYAQRIRWY
jgi:hypothetical protein